MRYVLDTHTWIWWHENPKKLSSKVKNIIVNAVSANDVLLLSAISSWEFCKLIEKKQLIMGGDTEELLSKMVCMHALTLVPLTPVIAFKSTVLPQPFHKDHADQIIVASAREENAILLTADSKIQDYPFVKSLW